MVMMLSFSVTGLLVGSIGFLSVLGFLTIKVCDVRELLTIDCDRENDTVWSLNTACELCLPKPRGPSLSSELRCIPL